ncbi:hypothetical protein QE152_g10702 [Popillia japonica]|uniref:Uncharacterized protein n=1 Tax=Popillia japonica TaxID=7064 RepID=A0AAW1LT47_POPJA
MVRQRTTAAPHSGFQTTEMQKRPELPQPKPTGLVGCRLYVAVDDFRCSRSSLWRRLELNGNGCTLGTHMQSSLSGGLFRVVFVNFIALTA